AGGARPVPGGRGAPTAPGATRTRAPAELSPAQAARGRRSLRAVGAGFVGTFAVLGVGAFYFWSMPTKVTPVNYAARGAGPAGSKPLPTPMQTPTPTPTPAPTPTPEQALLSVK